MLLASIVFVGAGVALYVSPNVMINPIEGLALAVSIRLRRSFHFGKTLVDCFSVAISLLGCMVFLDGFAGIREGTILSALLTGKVVHAFSHVIDPLVARLCKQM